MPFITSLNEAAVKANLNDVPKYLEPGNYGLFMFGLELFLYPKFLTLNNRKWYRLYLTFGFNLEKQEILYILIGLRF